MKKVIYLLIALLLIVTSYGAKSMADPTAFQPQSTDRLPGTTNPSESVVLNKYFIRVNSSDYTLTGSWYRAIYTIDLSQLNFGVSPTIEAKFSNSTGVPTTGFYNIPTCIVNASGAVIANYQVYINTGAKVSGTSTKIIFDIGGASNPSGFIYFRVMSMQGSSTDYIELTPTIT